MRRLLARLPKGFGLVEVLVVTGLVALALPSIGQLLTLSIQATNRGINQVEALYLAQEGLEVVRVLRHQSWSGTIDPIPSSSARYPEIIAGNWTLSAADPGLINGQYTRVITLDSVNRDASSAIVTDGGGTLDPRTRLATATVSWSERGDVKSVTLKSYLTDYLDN